MNKQLRLIWRGKWIFDAVVGLKLKGYPNNEKAFIELLASHSCHPSASNRIMDRIKRFGFDKLTVMNALPFYDIKLELEKLDVKLTIIKPKHNWVDNYKDIDKYIPIEYLNR